MRPSYPDARDYLPNWMRFVSDDDEIDTELELKACRALEWLWREACRLHGEHGSYEIDWHPASVTIGVGDDFTYAGHFDPSIDIRAGAEPPPRTGTP